jgi:hypothetical protein
MNSHRRTFRQIIEESRVETATAAWKRAAAASNLRHFLNSVGHHRWAREMGKLKARCLERVVEILPEQVQVTIDDNYPIGLVIVDWARHGRLHLPAGSPIKRSA